MNELIDQVKIDLGKNSAQDLADYVMLLRSGAKDAFTAQKVREVMLRLNKTVMDLEADAKVIAEVIAAERAFQAGRGFRDQILAAQKNCEAAKAECDAVIAAAQEKYKGFQQLVANLQSRDQAACNAIVRLGQLKAEFPAMLIDLNVPKSV